MDRQPLAKLWVRRSKERILKILIGWSSIVRQVAWERGEGGRGRYYTGQRLKESIKSLLQSLRKVESSYIFLNACGHKDLIARQVAIQWYITLGNFWCNLCTDQFVTSTLSLSVSLCLCLSLSLSLSLSLHMPTCFEKTGFAEVRLCLL